MQIPAKMHLERPGHGLGTPDGPLRAVLYVFAGPLIWLTTLVVLSVVGAWGCAGTGLTTAVELLGIAGCIMVMYHALNNARRAGRSERERLPHFFAGGIAALGMAGIGATALAASLATSC